nr:MAG TPA: hypothetical protein [Caudoviricetes sp.]
MLQKVLMVGVLHGRLGSVMKKMKDNMKSTFVLNTLTDHLNRLQKLLFMKWCIL